MPRRSVAVMTALPLFWGEGGAKAVLAGPDLRAPIITALEAAHRVRPVDLLDTAAFTGTDILLLAQPRILGAQELVDLDAWVRRGGHALIFADPELVWPSALPMGDPRRAPPVTLLDPLFTHWGITLAPDAAQAAADVDGQAVWPDRRGRWITFPAACQPMADALILSCTIGKGRALLVADADLLDRPDGEAAPGILALIERAAR